MIKYCWLEIVFVVAQMNTIYCNRYLLPQSAGYVSKHGEVIQVSRV